MFTHCFAISAYGDSPYLETCIRSLKEQRGLKAQVILCTSTPSPFLEELALKYSLPYYVREGKSSLQEDWNFAVEKAVYEKHAEYVTVAHQDDVYRPDYLKALRAAVSIYPDLSLFCTRYRTIDKDGQPVFGKAENVKRLLRLPLRLRGLADRRWVKRAALCLGNSIGCPSCTYHIAPDRREKELPLFRKDYHFVIDWDTLLRLADQPGRFVCLEKELLDYRVHDQAETRKNIDNHVREKEETEMFRRLWPGPVAGFLMHFYKGAYSAYQ